MRVLFTCADKPTISRNRFHRHHLQERESYDECVSEAKNYALRIPSILFRLLFKMRGKDAFFVGYMGHFLVLYLRLFTSKPIIFDFYLSIFDMMCNDRKVYSPTSLLGRLTYWIEKRSLQKADYIIVDTYQLIKTLSETYQIPKEKFVRVPLTINEEDIFPLDFSRYKEPFTVLYVGSYIPLHGTPVIIEAARILQELGDDTFFLMIGKGPQYQTCRQLSQQYKLENIEFKGFMSLAELNRYYNAADINLGLFNNSERANSVVLNKTNDAFRVGRPHLTLATDAMQELFEDNKDIFFVSDTSPETLAARILELKRDPSLIAKVGREAMVSYNTKLSNAHAKQIVEQHILNPLQQKIGR